MPYQEAILERLLKLTDHVIANQQQTSHLEIQHLHLHNEVQELKRQSGKSRSWIFHYFTLMRRVAGWTQWIIGGAGIVLMLHANLSPSESKDLLFKVMDLLISRSSGSD